MNIFKLIMNFSIFFSFIAHALQENCEKQSVLSKHSPHQSPNTFEQFNQLPSDVQKEILLFAASPKAHIDYGQEKDETKKYVDERSYVKAFIKRLASYKAINKNIHNWLTSKEIIEGVFDRDIKNNPGKIRILNELFHEIIFEPEQSTIFKDQSNKDLKRKRGDNILYSSYQDGNLLKLLLESGYIHDINEAINNKKLERPITPLESAVIQDLPELVQLLIDHRADPYQKISSDKENKTILDLTKENSLIRSILLKEKTVTINTSSIIDLVPDNLFALLYRAYQMRYETIPIMSCAMFIAAGIHIVTVKNLSSPQYFMLLFLPIFAFSPAKKVIGLFSDCYKSL